MTSLAKNLILRIRRCQSPSACKAGQHQVAHLNHTIFFESRSFYTGASFNPYRSGSSTSLSNSIDNESSAEEKPTTKSADDFESPNIYVNGIPFFSNIGMAMFRVVPARFRRNERGAFITNANGCLYLTFYPRSEVEINKFDTTKRVRFQIRAVDIGSILEIDAKKLDKEITIQGSTGHLQVRPGDDEGTLILKGIPRARFEDSPEFIETEIPTGQFKTLQTILTHTAPVLFGWQVLADPTLVYRFLDTREERPKDAKPESDSFFNI